MGLCGLVVLQGSNDTSQHRIIYEKRVIASTHSQLTSTITLNRRDGPAAAMNSLVRNLGIGLER